MEDLKIEYFGVDEIKPYEKNPRKNDGAVEAVANSIKEFGFKNPIIVNKDLIVIAGHTRLKASKKLGLKKVPCVVVRDLTEEQERALRIADNKTSELAEWDLELLQQEIEQIMTIDMTDFGFEEVAPEPAEVVEDNYEPTLKEETRTQVGQVWKLGEHRLYVGDATETKSYDKLMGDEKADMVLTDPPYNVAYESADGKSIQNDKMENFQFEEFLTSAFKPMVEFLKEGRGFYVFHASRSQREFENALNEAGLQVREQLIWNKNSFTLGRQDYQWKHEPILYGWKDGDRHYFTNDRTQATVYEQEPEDLEKMKKDDLIALIKEFYKYTTVIDENKPLKDAEHPTMKPIKLMARFIENSSKPGEIVLDNFGGSGSTLMACEQTGRKCRTMELDPQYADVILDRWEKFTGKTAELMGE